ncbi:MAG: TrbI/VirB10 family protein [Verrucomicrobiota bacterium]
MVQTIERPIQPFHPPTPKLPPAAPAKINEPPKVVVEKPKPESSSVALASLSLFADSSADVVEPKGLGTVYAPFGRLISCETVITVDSASIQTPIIGLVTENVYHTGRLVIPAGTEVHGTAQTDHHRERIASGTSWTLVWQSGEELRLKAIALDREFETGTNQVGWGITDGSAGLRGELIKADSLAEIKLFAATYLSGAAGALTETQHTLLGSVASPTLNNAPLQGAQAVLQTYAKRIYDSIQRDGFYVRVPSGKQFYLYVVQTIDRGDAVIGGTLKPFAEEEKTNAPASRPAAAFGVGPTPTTGAVVPNSTPIY